MEEEGIGKLSQTLDSREADLEDLHEKEGCYEKEIKVSITTIVSVFLRLTEISFLIFSR
jgi:hypothetical protein